MWLDNRLLHGMHENRDEVSEHGRWCTGILYAVEGVWEMWDCVTPNGLFTELATNNSSPDP